MQSWDLLGKGVWLEGEHWRELVHSPEAEVSGSIVDTLLDQLAKSCYEKQELWERYVEATRDHLDSKRIRLADLGNQVRWLASCRPAEGNISAPLELAWLTAELEHANHLGKIDEGLVKQLKELGDKLFEEEPALVCQAELDLAVLATNCFEFTHASRALDPWKKQPVAVAGRRHWGRIQSSLGQHAAFLGNPETAREHFANAIRAFEQLSDTIVSANEISQTATYDAMVAMDDPTVSLEDARERVQRVVSLRVENIRSIAVTTERRYVHHLLTRFLVARGSETECDAYLDARDAWDFMPGHPWTLVEGYRAILLHQRDPEDAEGGKRMFNGYTIGTTEEHGPTVRLIALTLGAIASGWAGETLVDESELERLEQLLPAAKDALSKIRNALAAPCSPAEKLLQDVLPFSFR